jgi:hypothetical protein
MWCTTTSLKYSERSAPTAIAAAASSVSAFLCIAVESKTGLNAFLDLEGHRTAFVVSVECLAICTVHTSFWELDLYILQLASFPIAR